MKVVSLNPKEHESAKRKADLLEVLNEMRDQIESGAIQEFVACSLDTEGAAQIHASCYNLVVAAGLYEIGKHMIIHEAGDDDN